MCGVFVGSASELMRGYVLCIPLQQSLAGFPVLRTVTTLWFNNNLVCTSLYVCVRGWVRGAGESARWSRNVVRLRQVVDLKQFLDHVVRLFPSLVRCRWYPPPGVLARYVAWHCAFWEYSFTRTLLLYRCRLT